MTLQLKLDMLFLIMCVFSSLTFVHGTELELGLAGCQFNVVCEEPILNFWTTISADQCKNQCRNIDQADWFTWNSQMQFCACLKSCESKTNSEDFISGPLYCSQSGCAKSGACSGGRFLRVSEANSFTGCQQSCAALDTCHWATFNQDNGWCILYSDCPIIQVTACPSCLTSKRNCENTLTTSADPHINIGSSNQDDNNSVNNIVRENESTVASNTFNSGDFEQQLNNNNNNGQNIPNDISSLTSTEDSDDSEEDSSSNELKTTENTQVEPVTEGKLSLEISTLSIAGEVETQNLLTHGDNLASGEFHDPSIQLRVVVAKPIDADQVYIENEKQSENVPISEILILESQEQISSNEESFQSSSLPPIESVPQKYSQFTENINYEIIEVIPKESEQSQPLTTQESLELNNPEPFNNDVTLQAATTVKPFTFYVNSETPTTEPHLELSDSQFTDIPNSERGVENSQDIKESEKSVIVTNPESAELTSSEPPTIEEIIQAETTLPPRAIFETAEPVLNLEVSESPSENKSEKEPENFQTGLTPETLKTPNSITVSSGEVILSYESHITDISNQSDVEISNKQELGEEADKSGDFSNVFDKLVNEAQEDFFILNSGQNERETQTVHDLFFGDAENQGTQSNYTKLSDSAILPPNSEIAESDLTPQPFPDESVLQNNLFTIEEKTDLREIVATPRRTPGVHQLQNGLASVRKIEEQHGPFRSEKNPRFFRNRRSLLIDSSEEKTNNESISPEEAEYVPVDEPFGNAISNQQSDSQEEN